VDADLVEIGVLDGVGPVSSEDGSGIRVDLDLKEGVRPEGALEAQVEASDAGAE